MIQNCDAVQTAVNHLIDETVSLRGDLLLSQKQVATLMGLASHGSINAIESKKTIPRLDTFLRLLAVYGCELQIVPKTTDEV